MAAEKNEVVTEEKTDTENTTEGRGGRRYLPYVFTEQGISMLANVLHSDVAVNVSIGIMRAFVEMRHFIANNAIMFERISAVELRQLQYQEQTDAKLEQMGLAGWSADEMCDGLSGVLNLAAASEMDLASASDIVTDYLSAFGLTAADSEMLVDKMAYAMNNSNTSTSQLERLCNFHTDLQVLPGQVGERTVHGGDH